MKIIEATRASAVSGDDLMEMTDEHTDGNGNRYPEGTVYRPFAHGYDNAIGRDYQDVTIAGKRVRFYGEE